MRIHCSALKWLLTMVSIHTQWNAICQNRTARVSVFFGATGNFQSVLII